MSISFFNTISGKKEEFKPLNDGKVTMYCCGITPSNSVHIGHSRTFFTYDLLYRTLKDHDYDIQWARNVTDVDDKIIAKANSEGVSCETIVNRYVAEQDSMLQEFHLLKPQHEPKVTEHIAHVIDHIKKLIANEMAYASSTGVYFRVRKYEQYGKLSKNRIDELRIGVRIDVDDSKEDPLDFALWKFAKPGEIKWTSPWGEGRPGWHIECSAMVHALFGDTIDIHMGGRDLIFPHHEAEIAQSEGASGKEFSKIWMHAGMLTLNNEKMSKSTNHFVSITDFLSKYPGEVLRLFFLSAGYTQPLDFTFDLADQNLKKLSRLYRFVDLVDSYANTKANNLPPFEDSVFQSLETLIVKMRNSLADDLNSAASLAVFFEFVREVNTSFSKMEKQGKSLNSEDINLVNTYWPTLKNWLANTLGILVQKPDEFFKSLHKYKLGTELSSIQIQQKIDLRKQARDNKNWKESDTIRDELLAQGIQIQDAPQGTKWTVQL